MSFFTDLSDELAKLRTEFEPFVDKLCKVVEFAAPVAGVVGTVTGNPEVTIAAQQAPVIASGVDKAITAHQAAGATPEAATAGLAVIAKTVADSGVVDVKTSAKINQVLQALDPAILAGITGA